MSARNYPHTGHLLGQLPGREPATEEVIPTPPITSSDKVLNSAATSVPVDELSDEIYAPPVDSSDEASQSDGGSPSPRNNASTGIQPTDVRQTKLGSLPDRIISSSPDELQNPGSNIPATAFTVSGRGDRSFSHQSNPRRRIDHMESNDDSDDEFNQFKLLKSKKSQLTYRKRRASITQSPDFKNGKRKCNNIHSSHLAVKKEEAKFIKHDTASILSKSNIVPSLI